MLKDSPLDQNRCWVHRGSARLSALSIPGSTSQRLCDRVSAVREPRPTKAGMIRHLPDGREVIPPNPTALRAFCRV